jgi:hypothetical protein
MVMVYWSRRYHRTRRLDPVRHQDSHSEILSVSHEEDDDHWMRKALILTHVIKFSRKTSNYANDERRDNNVFHDL